MIAIEAKNDKSIWIAALCLDEKQAEDYLKEISGDKNLLITKRQIALSRFPIYAVNRSAHFEYMDYESLLQCISDIEPESNDQKEYFSYYIFESEYIQKSTEENGRSSVYFTVVNNNFLNDYYKEYGARCITREMLENLAYYVDIERMDAYSERCLKEGAYDDKAELAEAYMQLFGQICYDYACSKYSYEGLQDILEIVEKVEMLQGETLWELRADAYMNLLEAAAEEDPEQTLFYGEKCVEALNAYIAEVGEEYIPYQKLSRVLHLLADQDDDKRFKHWKDALISIKKAVEIAPEEVNWIYYLQLLYTPLMEEDEDIEKNLPEEKKRFNELVETLQLVQGIQYRIASDFHRLQDSGIYDISEEEYVFWLDKSLERDAAVNYDFPELSDAAHFYHSEGVKRHRLDLLQRSLEYYLFQRNNEPRAGFTIHYIAKNLEDIATVYQENGKPEKADDYLSQALSYYMEHEDVFMDNFSVLSHYGEFLERCYYHYNGKSDKPSIEKIRSIAKLAEKEGNGFYSGPFLLQARMALEEKNEDLAIFQLQRSLLLHELCIDKEIIKFSELYENSDFPKLNKFLKETLQFMKEVDEGYYYDPKIRWPEIQLMNKEQTNQVWENRMKEIRSRK